MTSEGGRRNDGWVVSRSRLCTRHWFCRGRRQRNDFPKLIFVASPLRQDLAGTFALGVFEVLVDQFLDRRGIRLPARRSRRTSCGLMWLSKAFGLVKHVRDAARHAGTEVAARPAEDDHRSVGHVLATVVTQAPRPPPSPPNCAPRTARPPGRWRRSFRRLHRRDRCCPRSSPRPRRIHAPAAA